MTIIYLPWIARQVPVLHTLVMNVSFRLLNVPFLRLISVLELFLFRSVSRASGAGILKIVIYHAEFVRLVVEDRADRGKIGADHA